MQKSKKHFFKACLGNLFSCTLFFGSVKYINKFLWSRNSFPVTAIPLIFFKKIFTQGFYLHSFYLDMEFFHLERHSIDLVKEKKSIFRISFRSPFFNIIFFVTVEVVVSDVAEQPFNFEGFFLFSLFDGGSGGRWCSWTTFLFFLSQEIEEKLKRNSHLSLLF